LIRIKRKDKKGNIKSLASKKQTFATVTKNGAKYKTRITRENIC